MLDRAASLREGSRVGVLHLDRPNLLMRRLINAAGSRPVVSPMM